MGAGMDMFSVPGGVIRIMAGLAVCLAIKRGMAILIIKKDDFTKEGKETK